MIWLIGSNGILGSAIASQLEANNIKWIGTNEEIDITNPLLLEKFQVSHDVSFGKTGFSTSTRTAPEKITWVINASSYSDVDKAESENDRCQKVNAEGALNVARTARKMDAKLIHFSSDYVFDGKKTADYAEDDRKNPVNVYGSSKLEGEYLVQKESTRYYIIRTSFIYGKNKDSLAEKIAEQAIKGKDIEAVYNLKTSPTSADDVALFVLKIIQQDLKAKGLFGNKSALPYGVYNFSSMGEASYEDFVRAELGFLNKYWKIPEVNVIPVSNDEAKLSAKRPERLVLSKEKILSHLKIKIPDWKTGLEKFIKNNRF